MLHKLIHFLNLNTGICSSFYDERGRLMMSFVCNTCGKREGIHCVDKIIDREIQNNL